MFVKCILLDFYPLQNAELRLLGSFSPYQGCLSACSVLYRMLGVFCIMFRMKSFAGD